MKMNLGDQEAGNLVETMKYLRGAKVMIGQGPFKVYRLISKPRDVRHEILPASTSDIETRLSMSSESNIQSVVLKLMPGFFGGKLMTNETVAVRIAQRKRHKTRLAQKACLKRIELSLHRS